MARSDFCVITGNVGAGKTTLVRHVLKQLDQDVQIGLVSNTQCDSFEELLRWILLAYGLDYKGKGKVEMYDDFIQFLIHKHSNGTPVTLIIDEAQNLDIENLEQLRMLSNVNTEKGQILQTVLVGQPELWSVLKDPRLEQLAQRISYEYFLEPLGDEATVKNYIQYRVKNAGGKEDLFDEGAYATIWEATRGIPRLINLVCDTALVYGYAEDITTIPVSLVQQIVREKQTSLQIIDSRVPSKAIRSTEGARLAPHTTQAPSISTHADNVDKRKLSTVERAALTLKTRS